MSAHAGVGLCFTVPTPAHFEWLGVFALGWWVIGPESSVHISDILTLPLLKSSRFQFGPEAVTSEFPLVEGLSSVWHLFPNILGSLSFWTLILQESWFIEHANGLRGQRPRSCHPTTTARIHLAMSAGIFGRPRWEGMLGAWNG